MSSRPFYEALPPVVEAGLPDDLRGIHHRRHFGVLKFFFDHPETHYEVAYHSRTARVEVGLHLEASREVNAAALEFFRGHMVEVKGGLPRAELEPWDRGWARLYETFPALVLDATAADRAARLMAEYVTTLQPLLDDFWG